MKTTIDIPDALLEQLKFVAAQEGVTLLSLVEEALRGVLSSRAGAVPCEIRDASVTGSGLNPEFADIEWAIVRENIYPERGT